MDLFDAHCHMQDERLLPDLVAVMERSRSAGIRRLCSCGSCEEDWPALRKLAVDHAEILPSYGLHPWYVGQRTDQWSNALEGLLRSDPAAGVGEIGLDHAVKERNDDAQMQVFLAQLELARDLRRPASIHCRQAWGALLEALTRFGDLPAGFVVHSYSGSVDLIPTLTARGAYISFSGSLTYPGNKRAHKNATQAPPDRLLIETDAPDLYPYLAGERSDRGWSSQGRINEPANLPLVLRKLAETRGMREDALAAQILDNAQRLFGTRASCRTPVHTGSEALASPVGYAQARQASPVGYAPARAAPPKFAEIGTFPHGRDAGLRVRGSFAGGSQASEFEERRSRTR